MTPATVLLIFAMNSGEGVKTGHAPYSATVWRQVVAPVLSLFTSLGTLVCCALPALFVTLGMGAALVGVTSAAPWLVVLSEYKLPVFVAAGAILLISAYLQWRSRNALCPADPARAKACGRLRRISLIMLALAVFIYCTGFFFAFVAVHVFY